MTYYKMFGEDLSVYRELPVDIDTFIEDAQYIGNFTNGGKSIYSFWRSELKKMFHPDNPNRYYQMVNATAIGCGKTKISLIAFSYTLYCYMCLYNPNKFFVFTEGGILSFALVSMDKIYVDQLYEMFIDIIKDSPWFQSHGVFDDENSDNENSLNLVYKPFGNSIEIIKIYKEKHIFGKNLVCYDFQWMCDNYKGLKAITLHSVCHARVKSRTVSNEKTYGRIILDYELSNNDTNIKFLEYKKECSDSLVVNDSQWHIKPQGTFDMSNFFGIVYDGIYGHSCIFDQDYINGKNCQLKEKYKMISVPINCLSIAKLDIDMFLLNFAGIQLKKLEKHLTFMQAIEELITGESAIMIDGSNFYFAMNDNEEIFTYTLGTNVRNYDHTTNIFSCYNGIQDYILAENWIAFPNPVK